jgi:TonB family protein
MISVGLHSVFLSFVSRRLTLWMSDSRLNMEKGEVFVVQSDSPSSPKTKTSEKKTTFEAPRHIEGPSVSGQSSHLTPFITIEEVVSWGNTPPTYPTLALREGWEGEVQLELEFSRQGRVERVNILRSSGYKILDEAAFNSARSWTRPTDLESPLISQLTVEFKILD